MLEKRNPIPAGGRYWIDIFGLNRPDFIAWLASKRGSVAVESTQAFDTRDWYVFKTLAPVEWGTRMAMQFGWPTVAGPEVKSSSDTAQTPAPESGVSLLLKEVSDYALPVAIGVGVYLLLKELK